MMHQKAKLNHKVLTRIRYFSYSISLTCIMTLLGGLIYGTCFILPEFQSAYAAEVASSTASMSIASPTLSNTITPNNTTYVSTNVTIDAKYIQNYTLKISGNANLSGPSTITGAGGKTPANMSNNTWGYNWGNTGTTDSTLTYNSLTPSGTNLTLNSLSNGAANFTKKLTFAVKFGEANTGHYTSTVNLAFTATPKTLVGYSVSYNVNGGLGGPDDYSEQSYDTSKSYTIPTIIPTRDGYSFLGWNTSSTATTANSTYAPGKTISLTSSSPTRALYAVWKDTLPPTVTGFGGVKAMQDFSCNNAAAKTSGQLYDKRDYSTYTVAKLSDGKCWMTQNLRITRETIQAKDINNTTGTITSTDTNADTNYNIPASANGAFDSTKDSNGFYTNQQARAATNNDHGAYYSYNVATLNKVASQSSGTATYDICPKGWRLPTGGSSGELQTLYDKGSFRVESPNVGWWFGGASADAAGAAFFPAAGWVDSRGLVGRNTHGSYWSSAIYNTTDANVASFAVTVSPSSTNMRFYGCSVRCVAK